LLQDLPAAVRAAVRESYSADFSSSNRVATSASSTLPSPILATGRRYSILIAGFIVVGAALVVEIKYRPPYWLHALLWGPLILLVTLGPLRVLKSLLIALQYHYGAAEGRLDQ
jgi:Protein of unknown function (DUF983)